MTRALGAAISVVLAAGIIGALTKDEGGAFDPAAAERCGIDLARHAGFDPSAATVRIDQETYRVSVSIPEGVLALAVRRDDGRVLDAAVVGPGGARDLERETRLAIYERGC